MVFLVFVSGKVVLTGAKSFQDLQRALELMYPVFCEFRKQVGICIITLSIYTIVLFPLIKAALSNQFFVKIIVNFSTNVSISIESPIVFFLQVEEYSCTRRRGDGCNKQQRY